MADMFEMKFTPRIDAIKKQTKKFTEEIKKEVEQKMWIAVLYLENLIRGFAPVGGGPIHLRDTIFSDVDIFPGEIKGKLGTPCKYADAVEFGTKPHLVPIKALVWWAEKKFDFDKNRAWATATAVQKKIAERGTKGQSYFLKGFEKGKSKLESLFGRIPDDIDKKIIP